MAHAGAGLCQDLELLVIEMDAVGIPDVGACPAQALHVRQGPQSHFFQGVPLLVLGLAQVGVQAHAVLPRQDRALPQQVRRDGEGRAGRQRQPAHGLEGRVVIFGNQLDAVAHDFVHALHHGIRRQAAVLLGQIHAAAGEVHPHTQQLRRLGLCADEVPGVLREHIVVVKDGGAAVLQQLSHPYGGGKTDGILIQPLPDLVERYQPVKQLHILHLGQIPGKDLIEMVMGVDQAGVTEHSGGINHLAGLRGFRADGADQPVLTKDIHVLIDPILPVAGNQGADIAD